MVAPTSVRAGENVRLNVNIDHVATLRNARGTPYPDPNLAARICILAGAHGITAHLREDRRHIVDADVESLAAELRERGTLFNLEMGASDEMIGIALRTRPTKVTLVPERREERTTEGGLDVIQKHAALKVQIARLQDAGIPVSVFVEPMAKTMDACASLGVPEVELHTGEYANAYESFGGFAHSERLGIAARHAKGLGLRVAAGHGLTTANVAGVVAHVEIEELNIGHALVADALFVGLDAAVRAMLEAISHPEWSRR